MAQARTWIDITRDTLDPLYAFVARRTGGERELTEDVVQETYLRAVARFGDEGRPREPLAWLRTVARNLLATHFRRVRPATVDPAVLDAALSSSGLDTPDASRLVAWGLGKLRRRHARVLEAFHLDGHDVRTIASELGVTERAVEGRLRRGRLALRRVLAPHLDGQGEPS